jgi:hypothetical protein
LARIIGAKKTDRRFDLALGADETLTTLTAYVSLSLWVPITGAHGSDGRFFRWLSLGLRQLLARW